MWPHKCTQSEIITSLEAADYVLADVLIVVDHH